MLPATIDALFIFLAVRAIEMLTRFLVMKRPCQGTKVWNLWPQNHALIVEITEASISQPRREAAFAYSGPSWKENGPFSTQYGSRVQSNF